MRMKAEWETLQNNPSDVDDKIKAQLDILEQINNNAFNQELMSSANTLEEVEAGASQKDNSNPSEIGKMMQKMMRN